MYTGAGNGEKSGGKVGEARSARADDENKSIGKVCKVRDSKADDGQKPVGGVCEPQVESQAQPRGNVSRRGM